VDAGDAQRLTAEEANRGLDAIILGGATGDVSGGVPRGAARRL
jgi:hypothetical protein